MSHIFRAGACDSRDWVARLAAQPKVISAKGYTIREAG